MSVFAEKESLYDKWQGTADMLFVGLIAIIAGLLLIFQIDV